MKISKDQIKFGSLNSTKTVLGIRCLIIYPVNPIRQLFRALRYFFNYYTIGRVTFIGLPFIRFAIITRTKGRRTNVLRS